MNLQQCRYVEAIANTGSFTEAAKELYMTQPSLSSAIKDLEAEIGVQLFKRSNSGARLTDDGHDFLKYAKRILGEMRLLEQRYTDSFKKSFTIASHHYDFLSLPLAQIYQGYRNDYQEFQLIETTTKRILEGVANFECDLGIIYLDKDNRYILERSLKDRELDFIPLGDFPTRIFLGHHHPLVKKKRLSKKDLRGYSQIRFRQDQDGINFDEDVLEIMEEQSIIYSNDRGTVMNLLSSTDAYASGLGIINSFIKDQIVLLPLTDSPLHTLGFVVNRKSKLSPIAKDFIDLVQKTLEDTHF